MNTNNHPIQHDPTCNPLIQVSNRLKFKLMFLRVVLRQGSGNATARYQPQVFSGSAPPIAGSVPRPLNHNPTDLNPNDIHIANETTAERGRLWQTDKDEV